MDVILKKHVGRPARPGRCAIITLIFAVIVIAVVTAFSVQNASTVAITFLSWRFEASLAVVIVLSLLSGVIIGMVLLSGLRLRRSLRRRRSAAAEGAAPDKPQTDSR